MSPSISIVTPSYNQGEFIESTILSILNQNYPSLQLIVIDGGSTDNTVEILKRYSDRIAYWVSEPDAGQAAALNKGFEYATGDIMCYLNSDDLLLPGALCSVSNFFEANPDQKWLVSSTLVGCDLESATIWDPRSVCLEEFLAGQTFPQQGVFWRANILPYPWFCETFNFILDAEFFARLYRVCGQPAVLAVITSFFRQHADAKTSRISEVMEAEGPILLGMYKDLFSDGTLKRIQYSSCYSRFLCIQQEFRQCCKNGKSTFAFDLTLFRKGLRCLLMSETSSIWRAFPVITKSILLAVIYRFRNRN